MKATASDGTELDLPDLTIAYVYNADGTLQYSQVSTQGNTYRQTYTYTSGNVTNVTRWTKQ